MSWANAPKDTASSSMTEGIKVFIESRFFYYKTKNRTKYKSDVVQLNFIKSNFSERLCDELNNVVVIDDLIDITLVIRAGKDNYFAFIPYQLIELLEFI